MSATVRRLSLFLIPLLLLLCCPVPDGHCADKSIDYIYIDSSVDEAAGGHAAIRLAETVFHYQFYDDGYFLLEKTPWDEFRYQYNDRQNRTLAIASIPVDETTFATVKQHFLAQYLVQERRFEILDELKREETFLATLAVNKPQVPIRGLGFFAPETTDAIHLQSLQDRIAARLGPDFLAKLHADLAVRCREAARKLKATQVTYGSLDPYEPTLAYQSGIQEYLELRTLYEAAEVVFTGRALCDDSLIDNGPIMAALDDRERRQLENYRQDLQNSIIGLLQKGAPGNGRAILVQTAQYLAIDRSLATGRLITLDTFSDDISLIPLDKLVLTQVAAANRNSGGPTASGSAESDGSAGSYYNLLLQERLKVVQDARRSFQQEKQHPALAYAMLEAAQVQLHELIDAKQTNRELRVQNGLMAPGKIRIVHDSRLPTASDAAAMLTATREYHRLLQEKLLQTYGYNLFTKNCVTELFVTLYSSFPSGEDARLALGGYVDPESSMFFVPFLSFGMVRDAFSQSSARTLPSFRHRYLADRVKIDGFGALLQESNTLSSTIYSPWDEDSVFLFFTDDTILLRPIYGVINVVYAAIGSIGGLLWLPVDDGTLLGRSVKGIVFSLPEIGFWNIRKGTFPTVVE